MSGASVRFRLPPASLFKFPPDAEPAVLPAPDPSESFRTFAAPFKIDQGIYNAAFSAYIPVTIASVYAVTVLYMNGVNRERGGKPYAISRTAAFNAFVIVHNVALAIFSGLVFWAMLRALAHTWPSYREYPFLGKLWPGIRTQHGLAGAADALCKMHGPRGFGDAAAYNVKKGLWEIKNRVIHLGANGTPEPTDLGRLWNEGLAFWGWFFYLSKFYEVVDTAIIILKGKRSSTLQTYHHAGAMFCMWAGMRYMSPPIWMFVWINSGIHAMMYTYYTLAALGFKVPRRLKKTLTTMQIGQFLVGFTFAAGHLFVEYTLPSHITYAGKHGIKQAASAVSAAAATVSSAVADPTATAGMAAWIKKLAYRAAGEEGLAENVRNEYGEVFGPEADHVKASLEQMRRSPTYEAVNCIDTTGQSFAIWLNLIYLAPLTWLFLRFFVRSYSRRTSVSGQDSGHRRKLSKSAEDAAREVDRSLDSVGRSAEERLSELAKKAKKTADNRRVSETVEKFENGLSKGYEQAIEKGKQLGEQVVRKKGSVKDMVGKWRDMSPSKEDGSGNGTPRKSSNGNGTPSKTKDKAQSLTDQATEAAKKGAEAAKGQIQQGSKQAAKGAETAAQKATDVANEYKDKTGSVTEDVAKKASEARDAAKEQSNQKSDSAKDTAQDVKKDAKDKKDKSKKAAKDAAKKAKKNGQQASDSAESAVNQPKQEDKDSSDDVKQEDGTQGDAAEASNGQGENNDAQGPEESGVLVERHNEAAESSEKRAEGESDVASPPTAASATGESGGPSGQQEESQLPTSDKPVTEDSPQGLSTTDSTAEGAKSYADELK